MRRPRRKAAGRHQKEDANMFHPRFRLVALCCATTIVAHAASSVVAQVTSVRWANVDNTVDDVPGDDFDPTMYVTNDLRITFSGQFTGIQLLLELTQGSIYQNDSPLIGSGMFPPAKPLIEQLDPTLQWDTFIAFGGPTAGDTVGNFGAGGGAVGLGGRVAAQFDSERINQAWNPAGGVEIFDRSDFMVARVTLSNDAVGRWGIKTSANAQILRAYGSVFEGQIFEDFPGNYDGNRFVGQADLDIVLLNWGGHAQISQGGVEGAYVFVSQNELDDVLINWGSRQFALADATLVPEPITSVLLLVALVALSLTRLPTRKKQ
jgi:hypothetical protein